MRAYLTFSFLILVIWNAHAQKWQPGNFVDIKGNRVAGFIRQNPAGKGPIKDEGFIEFKDDAKSYPYKLSASDLHSFMIGKDSFVVAHAPRNETWTKNELDFVQVVINEETKLFVTKTATGGSGKGFGVSPAVGGGIGSGGYGGLGGGLAINLGGGGGKVHTTYYFGPNTAEMQQITPINFKDVMIEIMGDEPEVADKINGDQFNLGSIDKLIAYFKEVKQKGGSKGPP